RRVAREPGGGAGTRPSRARFVAEAEADAANGLDAVAVERTVELGAQPRDMDVDRVAAQIGLAVPDLVENLRACDDAAGSLGQHGEQVELAGRERDGDAVARHTATVAVDHEIADAQELLMAAASGEHAQPCKELVEGEGLGEVVVGAGVEAA